MKRYLRIYRSELGYPITAFATTFTSMKVPALSPRCMVGTETGPMSFQGRPSFGKNRLEDRTLIARAKVLKFIREYIELRKPPTKPDFDSELNSREEITNLIWEWLPRDMGEVEATYRAHEQELYDIFMRYASENEKSGDEPEIRLKQMSIYYYIYDHIKTWYRDTGDVIQNICASKQLGHVTAMLQAALGTSGNVHYKSQIRVVPR